MSNLSLIKFLDDSEALDLSKSFNLTKECNRLLNSDDELDNVQGRKVLIHALHNWQKISDIHKPIWIDLIEAAGFYPYLEPKKEEGLLSTAQIIRKESHMSRDLANTYFHEEQKEISLLLQRKKNVIVSAPTSFGKSLLIEAIVASRKHKNIVVIQPTLALLDETRKKLKRYDDSYKVIVKTSQEPSADPSKGNLFLLTAERVMEYSELPKVDFFVIDEFYKLSARRDDERSDVLNNAFHLLLKHPAQFYLLGPNINKISEGFAERYNAIFLKTDYSLVDNQEIDIYGLHKDKFDHPRTNKGYKEKVLFDLLVQLSDSQTLVYCSSPERARRLALEFCEYLNNIGLITKRQLSITSWIKENIHPAWSMIKCLEAGIGVHDGALPKHMTSSIIKYFNENKLNYLFCTSTIIEGVNTSAKNVVFFDPNKGKLNHKIDYFDYSNIRGRAGRLMKHFVGHIYNFNKPPKKEDVIIDIPFFDQKNASKEVLIHLDEREVRDKNTKEYHDIARIPETERRIIQKNGLSVDGQEAIVERLRDDLKSRQELVSWRGTPTYEQLHYLIDLAWDNLIKPTENVRPFTRDQITKLTFDYGYTQDINLLVRNQFVYYRKQDRFKEVSDEEVLDAAIRFAFQVLRHWFSYKVPKWLQSIDKLQKYVAFENGLKPGDYSFYASQIENDFIRPNLTILEEYGVPRSAIKKLERIVSEDSDEARVFQTVTEVVNMNPETFNAYELEALNEILG